MQVYDVASSSVFGVPAEGEGSRKWSGVAAVGATLYFAPRNAELMLVVDADTVNPCGNASLTSQYAGMASQLLAQPTPATHAILTQVKAGETV